MTYRPNGADSGNVPVDSEAYLEGATVTVKGNDGGLFKSCCSFACWNTRADGLGNSCPAPAAPA